MGGVIFFTVLIMAIIFGMMWDAREKQIIKEKSDALFGTEKQRAIRKRQDEMNFKKLKGEEEEMSKWLDSLSPEEHERMEQEAYDMEKRYREREGLKP